MRQECRETNVDDPTDQLSQQPAKRCQQPGYSLCYPADERLSPCDQVRDDLGGIPDDELDDGLADIQQCLADLRYDLREVFGEQFQQLLEHRWQRHGDGVKERARGIREHRDAVIEQPGDDAFEQCNELRQNNRKDLIDPRPEGNLQLHERLDRLWEHVGNPLDDGHADLRKFLHDAGQRLGDPRPEGHAQLGFGRPQLDVHIDGPCGDLGNDVQQRGNDLRRGGYNPRDQGLTELRQLGRKVRLQLHERLLDLWEHVGNPLDDGHADLRKFLHDAGQRLGDPRPEGHAQLGFGRPQLDVHIDGPCGDLGNDVQQRGNDLRRGGYNPRDQGLTELRQLGRKVRSDLLDGTAEPAQSGSNLGRAPLARKEVEDSLADIHDRTDQRHNTRQESSEHSIEWPSHTGDHLEYQDQRRDGGTNEENRTQDRDA